MTGGEVGRWGDIWTGGKGGRRGGGWTGGEVIGGKIA